MFWLFQHIIPIIAILDAVASPILYFQFLMLFLMSSSHLFFGLPNGLVNIGFYLCTFLTILSSNIQCKWPNQLNLYGFMQFIMFLCLINLSNSSFALILHVPSLSFVGPKIFLSTFLSNTINLLCIVLSIPMFHRNMLLLVL